MTDVTTTKAEIGSKTKKGKGSAEGVLLESEQGEETVGGGGKKQISGVDRLYESPLQPEMLVMAGEAPAIEKVFFVKLGYDQPCK